MPATVNKINIRTLYDQSLNEPTCFYYINQFDFIRLEYITDLNVLKESLKNITVNKILVTKTIVQQRAWGGRVYDQVNITFRKPNKTGGYLKRETNSLNCLNYCLYYTKEDAELDLTSLLLKQVEQINNKLLQNIKIKTALLEHLAQNE